MAAALLSLDGIELTFGGGPLLAGASIFVSPRARIALVGRNGSGKSTLLKIAAGIIAADAGERFVDPKASVAYLPQEPDFGAHRTTFDYVADGLPPTADEHAAVRALEEFGLAPDAATDRLSGGEARRAALARIFAAEPDVILLDEPTNHLDLPAIEALEARIKSSRAAMVIISHDRRFLENTTNETVWIDRGIARHLARGFGAFEEWRDKVLEEEETERHKLDRKIAMEEDWVRYGVTARRKRNVRRMAELASLRQKRRDDRKSAGTVNFSVNAADKSGKRVIVAEGLSKSFGKRTIVNDFSIEIARGDRVGFVGPNGAGKTTLLKLLLGELTPDAGKVTLGASLQVVTLDQRRDSLKPDDRLADAITDGRGDWVQLGETKKHVASYLKDFLFVQEQWRAPVSSLSGGERGRLALAAALAKPSNLLVLDEPTNDLDLETLDLLEEMLADYHGTLLLVSHDRSFLDRIATSIVAPCDEKAGAWREYVGGYSDMLVQRGAAPEKNAPRQPKPAQTEGNSREAPAPPKSAKSKLSYKEKYALETLPARMEKLQEEIAALKSALADPKLFERDAATFNKKAAALEKAEADLATCEEEWLELEMKREALEG